MSTTNKTKNTADRATGKVKEVTGVVTGNRDLQYRGQFEQIVANVKQAGEKLKDAFKL
jgi:uncharacterized protein YjbJ (UPF0337 family)